MGLRLSGACLMGAIITFSIVEGGGSSKGEMALF
jgi:hypothetical protein